MKQKHTDKRLRNTVSAVDVVCELLAKEFPKELSLINKSLESHSKALSQIIESGSAWGAVIKERIKKGSE